MQNGLPIKSLKRKCAEVDNIQVELVQSFFFRGWGGGGGRKRLTEEFGRQYKAINRDGICQHK